MVNIPENQKHKAILDKVVLNKFEVTNEEFIFDKLDVGGRVLYFAINTEYYLKKQKSHKRVIGFWHSIFTNQIEAFDFNQGFSFSIVSDSKFYTITYQAGVLVTDVSDESDFDLSNYQNLVIHPEKYQHIDFIQTKREREKQEKTAQIIFISKYVVSWTLFAVILSVFTYMYYQGDLETSTKNLLVTNKKKSQLNTQLSTLQSEVIVKTEKKIVLQHMAYMLKFINNNIKMSGELDLISDQFSFEFDTLTKVELVRYVAKKENIPIKLKYNFIDKSSKVSWRVSP